MIPHPLDRKLVRDLVRLRGQVLAIAVVIASGISLLVMFLGALESLRQTTDTYYERARFAEIFATAKRVPDRITHRLADIPGVQTVETRISRMALLDVPDFEEPVVGQLLSIPERGDPLLNQLTLRSGRSVAPGRPDECVVSEAFADEHGLRPGSRLQALINGNLRSLEIVGVALSPEFVYTIGPGALMPDNLRFGVVWMGRETLAAAFDLDGAWNDVSLTLWRGTSADGVILQVDALLERYGGTGAFAREDQTSNWFLQSEMDQIETTAKSLPAVFLAVAAFLTNMVLSRLIAVERAEIGLLKAFGYSSRTVGWHYTKLVLAIALLGSLLGGALGWWFGSSITATYAAFFRFPYYFFDPSPSIFLIGMGVSGAAALLGTMRSVRAAVRIPPAEAMLPPSPPMFRRSGLSSVLAQPFDQPTRIILRSIFRHPARSLATSTGIALSVGLLVVGVNLGESIKRLVALQFSEGQRQDVTVGLVEAQSSVVTAELLHLPGVLHAEPARFVSSRLRAGSRVHRESIQGVPADATLQPVFDAERGELALPREGLVLSRALAEILDVGHGDEVTVEVLEGSRPVAAVPVAGIFDTYLGTPAYMEMGALNRLMGERSTASASHLRIDSNREAELFRELKGIPEVASVMLKRAATGAFYETMGRVLQTLFAIFGLFACVLGFGVAYNSTRVSLSERARELATLRVLGLSRGEISYILLGEVGLLTFLGLPLGCLVGAGLSQLIADTFETELYRLPVAFDPSAFGIAVLATIVSVAASSALVGRRLDRLDLVAVLKTRE